MRRISPFGLFELPLFQREMIQIAQKRRTYVLRVTVAAIFACIMLIFYSENLRWGGGNILRVMGRGREMAGMLYACCVWAIYILMPALACSAISTEREKQTLSLLLISRITPVGLVIEKSLSRLMPLVVIVLIVSPMMAISYVLGGLASDGILAGLLAMLLAALQVNTVAIFCSSIFRNSLEAFFSSYLLLAAIAIGPAILQVMEIFPEFRLLPSGPSSQLGFLFDIYLIAAYEVMTGACDITTFLKACIPAAVLSGVFFVATCTVVSVWRQDAPLHVRRVNEYGRSLGRWIWRTTVERYQRRSSQPLAEIQERVSREVAEDNPVAWREVQSTALAGWVLHAILIGGLFLFELWIVTFIAYSRYDREAFVVLFRAGSIILSLLMMLGVASRSFASERERQTLDLLLTTPLSNDELLQGKLAASRRMRLYLMAFAAMTMLMRCFFDTQLYEGGRTQGPLSYCFGVLTHTWLYLTMAMWIGAFFSIATNSLMKAMLSSLLTLLGICIVPMLVLTIPMVMVGADPDDFPLWCFSSPAIVFCLNEALETGSAISRSNDLSMFWLCVNLAAYAGLTLVIKRATIRQFSSRLDRVDEVTQRSPHFV